MARIVRYTPDPDNPVRLTPEQEARLDALTDEEIEALALADPDNPPLDDAMLDRMEATRIVKRTRARLGISQQAFADRFRFPVDAVRAMEQGRKTPGKTALAYLRVIEREPEMVRRVLEAAATA